MPPRTPSFLDNEDTDLLGNPVKRPAQAKYAPPKGYYQADDANYPQSPSAIGGIVDPKSGLPNGVGSNMMGDPYSGSEIAAARHAPLEVRPGVPLPALKSDSPASPATVIHSAEAARLGNGSRDAQMLAALGPEYAQEGNRLLNDPSAKQHDITGRNETTGESFVMPVGNRVSRGALVPAIMRIQSEIAAKKLAEQQALKFGQDQTMARIPGQNAVDLAKQQGADKVTAIRAEGDIQAPTRQANIAKSNAETAGLMQTQSQQGQAFAENNSPDAKARAAADAAIKYIQDNHLATTPEGRQVIAESLPRSTMGRGMPASSAAALAASSGSLSPEAKFEAARGFTQDPEVQRLIASINAGRQGVMHSGKRKAQQDADLQALSNYAAQYGAAKNVDPKELLAQLSNQTVGATAGASIGPDATRAIGDALPLPLKLLGRLSR